VAVEAASLPLQLAEVLRAQGSQLIPVDATVPLARDLKTENDIEAIRTSCGMADVVQQSVKDHAAPGLTEAELAGLAQADLYRAAGERIPAILTLTTGTSTALPTLEPTDRKIAAGDMVMTDTSPWIDGAWSDSCNVLVMGRPDQQHVRVFDAVRRALELAISLCQPGAVSGEVDRRVRESLAEWGPSYPHHTGHGIGATWNEEPRIVPYNTRLIEEGMALAVEPAVYLPGWGGIRLEHVFVVRSGGNEVLTKFEHTL
jgi:Xaa-Pro aminopeptidase